MCRRHRYRGAKICQTQSQPNARMGESRSHRVFVGSVAAGATEVGGGALLVPITAFFSASGVFDQLIGDIVTYIIG